MFNDVCSTLGTRFDGGKNHLVRLRHLGPAQHGRSHEDRRQNVVQVMGDAAGQSADAFQPLSAKQLSLEFLVLGNVGVDDQH